MSHLAPVRQLAVCTEGKPKIFSVRCWGKRSAYTDARAGVASVNAVAYTKSEGNLGTSFGNPLGGPSLARLTDDIRFPQLSDRLFIGVGANAAVPVDVGVHFGTASTTSQDKDDGG